MDVLPEYIDFCDVIDLVIIFTSTTTTTNTLSWRDKVTDNIALLIEKTMEKHRVWDILADVADSLYFLCPEKDIRTYITRNSTLIGLVQKYEVDGTLDERSREYLVMLMRKERLGADRAFWEDLEEVGKRCH